MADKAKYLPLPNCDALASELELTPGSGDGGSGSSSSKGLASSRARWWAMAVLTGVCVALALALDYRWTRPISAWPIALPARRYTFAERAHLRDLDDPDAADRWAAMVRHDWWDSTWRDDAGRRFPSGIDVFHKMHCIVAIREEFVAFLGDPTVARGHEHRRKRDPAPEPADQRKVRLELNRDHLEHCFDFLRQDILCAADMSLEPLGAGYAPTDGQGVEHECRDWRLLLDHMRLPDMDEV